MFVCCFMSHRHCLGHMATFQFSLMEEDLIYPSKHYFRQPIISDLSRTTLPHMKESKVPVGIGTNNSEGQVILSQRHMCVLYIFDVTLNSMA